MSNTIYWRDKMENFGKVDIILDKYLKEHNISRSSLTRKTELQYSQILRYCRKEIKKRISQMLSLYT